MKCRSQNTTKRHGCETENSRQERQRKTGSTVYSEGTCSPVLDREQTLARQHRPAKAGSPLPLVPPPSPILGAPRAWLGAWGAESSSRPTKLCILAPQQLCDVHYKYCTETKLCLTCQAEHQTLKNAKNDARAKPR